MQIEFAISKPDVFSFKECLAFLNRSSNECLHHVGQNVFTKALQLETRKVLIAIREDEADLIISTHVKHIDEKEKALIHEFVSHLFDLRTDLQPFYKLLNHHNLFSYMPSMFNGVRIIGIQDLFECLCWCVIGQQINLSFAYQVKKRLIETYGEYVEYANNRYYLFPTPEVLAGVSIAELKAMKFSVNKAKYLIGISKLFCDGKLDQTQLARLPKAEILKALLEVKGIGLWTANYALMKTFKIKESIPYGDAGLNAALRNHGCEPSSKEAVDQVFEPFKGWESYLAFYLWRSLK